MRKQKTIKKILEEHLEDDRVRFAKQDLDHEEFRTTLLEIKGFMASLSWLSDISKGTQLLRRPSLWFMVFVLGLVALLGGIKSLGAMLISFINTK